MKNKKMKKMLFDLGYKIYRLQRHIVELHIEADKIIEEFNFINTYFKSL